MSGVLDLLEHQTGTRPQRSTLRGYLHRGQMPAQVQPGLWARPDIVAWIRTRRGRAAATRTDTALAALAKAQRDIVSGGRDVTIRSLVQAARATGASWTQIGNALGMTKQGAWERHRRG